MKNIEGKKKITVHPVPPEHVFLIFDYAPTMSLRGPGLSIYLRNDGVDGVSKVSCDVLHTFGYIEHVYIY